MGRILPIDDDAEVRLLVAQMDEGAAHSVSTAVDGEAVVVGGEPP
jgi:CheY-like chemotaxis protein